MQTRSCKGSSTLRSVGFYQFGSWQELNCSPKHGNDAVGTFFCELLLINLARKILFWDSSIITQQSTPSSTRIFSQLWLWKCSHLHWRPFAGKRGKNQSSFYILLQRPLAETGKQISSVFAFCWLEEAVNWSFKCQQPIFFTASWCAGNYGAASSIVNILLALPAKV